MLRVFLCLCLVVLSTPLYAAAQVTGSLIGSGPSLDLSPRYPEPNQLVTVSLNDYANNAGGGTIRWFVDGQELPESTNQRQISIVSGPNGKNQLVRARVTTQDGLALNVEHTITPYYLDLIIEPQTRVPVHYTGRALPSVESQVNVSAILSAPLSPNQLIYSWRINDTVLYSGPVLGQNRAVFTMPQGSAIVSVSVSSGERLLASRSIEIFNTEPIVQFYATNPLYGVSRLPVHERLILLGSSATVRAEPYYLDLATYNAPDFLEWTVAGGVSGTRTSNPYDLTVTRSGIGNVGFHVRNLTQVLQGTQGGFAVE